MGLQQSVDFESATVPEWKQVGDLLVHHGFAVQIKMIDGQLAFPDETPGPEWSELRLGTPGGMVTVRRVQRAVDFVVWGNADALLFASRNMLMWAFAAAGNGSILCDLGRLSAAEFLKSATLPAGIEVPDDSAPDS